jgi:biopolymer transport protein ExbD
MGMNVGSSAVRREPDVMMDINTTPLIDVMLVLLVMLIITIPIQLHSVNLEMPVGLEGRLSELAAQADPAELHIRPHRDSRYEVFAQVMVAARERGLNKLGVVGGEQFIGR